MGRGREHESTLKGLTLVGTKQKARKFPRGAETRVRL